MDVFKNHFIPKTRLSNLYTAGTSQMDGWMDGWLDGWMDGYRVGTHISKH